jgi:hypothetical protein
MAFKMKPKSPLTKKLVGKQHKLPAELKAAIKAAPEKSAMKKTTYDEETNTYYKDGRALRHNVRSDVRYSGKEAEAAEQLGSRKVDRSHRKLKRKASKLGQAKGLSKEAVKRRNTRRRDRAAKAKDRAEELTEKRFARTEKVGQDAYNRVIERYNKKAKDRAAQKNK